MFNCTGYCSGFVWLLAYRSYLPYHLKSLRQAVNVTHPDWKMLFELINTFLIVFFFVANNQIRMQLIYDIKLEIFSAADDRLPVAQASVDGCRTWSLPPPVPANPDHRATRSAKAPEKRFSVDYRGFRLTAPFDLSQSQITPYYRGFDQLRVLLWA